MQPESRWLRQIEDRAYGRLQQVRQRGLWNGKPPVPVELILEHALNLRISWEVIDEEPGETIFACLRPGTRQVVVNERHRSLFESQPGLERFSLAHEGGHADVFALAGRANERPLLEAMSYRPQLRSAAKGPVVSLAPRLRQLSPETRTAVLQELADQERARRVAGEDSPLVRRAVDHYAAVLLMPADLVRTAAAGRDVSSWQTVSDLARLFAVSKSALRIRLQEVGLIFGVDDAGAILLTDPAHRGQQSLF